MAESKLTNDELYRKMLLEWFDLFKSHPLMGMGSLTATRSNELKHLIEQCRPEDDKAAAGDVTYAKLAYEKPKQSTSVGDYGREYFALDGGYCIKAFDPAGWKPTGD